MLRKDLVQFGDAQSLGPPGEDPINAVSEDRGFSLIEAMVAVVITVIAVLGLAHTFGTGRALITGYESARAARALVDGRLETLASLAIHSPSDIALAVGTHGPTAVALSNDRVGTEAWVVEWVDDPADGPGDDYKRATVTVRWMDGVVPDSARLSRILRAP